MSAKEADRHAERLVEFHAAAAGLTEAAAESTRMRNAEVVWLVEHDGVSQTEVAGLLGVSKQRVNAMLKAGARVKQ
jgi:predicted XRE-type DNA-binding protein